MKTAAEITEFYQNNTSLISSTLTKGPNHIKRSYEVLVHFLGNLDGKRILDLGCGNGEIAKSLLKNNCFPTEYLGVDIVPKNISEAKKYFSSYNEFQFRIADIRKRSSFYSKTWDIILAVDVLEHCENQQEVLNFCHQSLLPNGKLFISIPNYFNVAGAIKKLKEIKSWPKNSWAPFANEREQIFESFNTVFKIKSLLANSGFKIQKIRGFDLIAGFYPFLYGPNGLKIKNKTLKDCHYILDRFLFHFFPFFSKYFAMTLYISVSRS